MSVDARADCTKLILPPDTVMQEKKIAIVRVSEINLRSGPGVRFCRFRNFGEKIQWKEVPVIGRHRTWRLVIMDGQKGWVHYIMTLMSLDGAAGASSSGKGKSTRKNDF